MNVSNSQSIEPKSLYVATVLMPNGQTKLVHSLAADVSEFEQRIKVHHDYQSIVWYQSLPKGDDEAYGPPLAFDRCLSELKVKDEEDKSEDILTSDIYTDRVFQCLKSKPDIRYIALGPILVCPEHLFYIQPKAFSHNSNCFSQEKHKTFVNSILGNLRRSFPRKSVIEVTGGGLRENMVKRFSDTCRPYLCDFTDVRYFHTGNSSPVTHLIQSHVFLLWQMLNEASPFAVDLGSPLYDSDDYKLNLSRRNCATPSSS